MLFDLHVHSAISPCSTLTIDDILANARARNLDGVCITDHDTMEAAKHLKEGIQDDGLCVIIGMEYETQQGDFLLFGPFEDLRPGLAAATLLSIVEERNGAAIAAHPFRTWRPVHEHIIRDGLCRLVECVNGRNSDAENIKARTWLDRYGVIPTAGSDAHTLEELGQFPTRVTQAVGSRHELIQALRNGCCAPTFPSHQTFVAQGYPHF